MQSIKFIYCDIQKKYQITSISEIWLLPFSTCTWILIVITYVLSAIVLWMIWVNKRSGSNQSYLNNWKTLLNSSVTHIFQIISKLLNQDGSFSKQGIKIHIIQFLTSMNAVVLLIYYTSIMTSDLIAPLKPIIIPTFKELVIDNGYKIQFQLPDNSSGWSPHFIWYYDLFKSQRILVKINQSFNIQINSNGYRPIEYEMALLTHSNNTFRITVGKTKEETPFYLNKLTNNYPNATCWEIVENVENYFKYWAFVNRFNERFVKTTMEYFTYGIVQLWAGIDQHKLIV